MNKVSLSVGVRADLRQRLKLEGTLKAVRFSLAPESSFRRYIRETEQEELFKHLAFPQDPAHRVIRFVPFRNAGCGPLRDISETPGVRDRTQPDVESLLSKAPGVRDLIARIGEEAFSAHFLRGDGPLDRASLAQDCGIEPGQMDRLVDWVNSFFVQCHFSEPSSLSSGGPYVKVAAFEKSGDGWSVRYYSPVMARGRYAVDSSRLEALRAGGMIQVGDRSLKRLLRRLELINERKTGLDLVLQWFSVRQKTYLDSGDAELLLPLHQKDLAGEVGRDPSTICRTLQGRSVVLPWGEERPLRDLFVTRKQQMKLFWDRECGLKRLSDEDMREVLFRRFGVRLSRRSMTAYRRELGLPSGRARG